MQLFSRRRISRAIAAGSAVMVAALGAPGTAASQGPPTTLDRTIVPTGERSFDFGPGEPHITRTLPGWDVTAGRGRPFYGFKQVSDIHSIDEESPARVEYFDECEGADFSSAYRPQESTALHTGEMMLRRLARINRGPATGASLDFVISTGDNADNNQFNETRWFIRLLDGLRVNPSSGGASYDGYTQAETSQAWPTRYLEMANLPFQATGTKVPWFAVLGNHDGLVQGNVNARDLPEAFLSIPIADVKAFVPIDDYDNCPESASDMDGVLRSVQAAFLGRSRQVPPDRRRRLLRIHQLIAQYFNTPARPGPVGHGFRRAPQDPVTGTRAGYYSFPMGPAIRGISLNTIADHGGSNGSIPDPQFRWLERQLRRWSRTYFDADGNRQTNPNGTNRLIVLFAHHSSASMANAGDPESSYAPFHCFSRDDSDPCAQTEGLRELSHRYPNVVLFVSGHEHNNAVRGFEPPEGADPARGFWEMNTAAHIDWPIQSRLVEIAVRPGGSGEPDTVYLYGTIVDHGSALTPDEERQARVPFLASLARAEAYFDACVRPSQAKCGAGGTELDRNVKLVLKAPFKLTR